MKITSANNLNVGTEMTIDTAARTFTLIEAGNLVAKDGVTLQALYSKFIKLWETAAYNKYPFPMYVIDASSGQFQFGTDGASFNGWKPATDATRQMMRDGGWSEYSALGVLNRQYVGIVSLGDVSTGAQLYYQRQAGDAPVNFTFTDEANEGIQVFGDAGNGAFDKRAYFKSYCREAGKKYSSSTLVDTGKTGTGAFLVNVLLDNGGDVENDLKITANDVAVAANAPYTAIDVTYYGADQNKAIGAGSYPFRVIVDNTTAAATLEEIYTKVQFLLRQATDIDEGAGEVVGKTADELMYFVGDTLYTTQGVFIEGVIAADVNRVVFLDQNSVTREYPYTSSGVLNFNSFLTSGGTGYFRVYFTNDDAGNDAGADYGTAAAITVNDATGTPLSGAITGASIPISYGYDANVQRGAASAGDDAPVTIVAGNKGVAKPVITTGIITKAKGLAFSLVAEQDRAYTP